MFIGTSGFTHTLKQGTISLNGDEGVTYMKLTCKSGKVTLCGSKSFKDIASTPIEIEVGKEREIKGSKQGLPLQGYTIDAAEGEVEIQMDF